MRLTHDIRQQIPSDEAILTPSLDGNVMLRRPLWQMLAEHQVEQPQIPNSWNHASALDEGTYYIIPQKLMTLVIRHVGRERFSSSDLERESELGRAAGNRWGNVAIRNGGFVEFPDLEDFMPVEIDPAAAEVLGKNREQARQLARTATSRLRLVSGARRGYLGWLLTRSQFLDEHDALLSRCGTQIQQLGFPHPARLGEPVPNTSNSVQTDWVDDLRRFYARWRLQSMVLPYLPRPLSYEIPSIQVPACEKDAGILNVSIPDIYSTPGRGPFNEMIEDALRGTARPENLNEWLRIVQSGNMGKKVIPMYERWFRLQHYWRLLHRRYPDPLRRKKSALIEAFAMFFDVSIDAVKSDVQKIGDLLGSDWERRFVRLS